VSTDSPSRPPRRIGLLGAESSGKTTLAEDLAATIDAFIADEYLRDFVRDFARLPALADQEGIYLTQQATVSTVQRAAAHAAVPWVIADPLPLMTAVYSIVYFDDATLVEQGIEDASTYDLLLWCSAEFPGVPEPGIRDGDDVRARTDDVIAEAIAPRLPLLRLTGDPAARLERAHAALEERTATP
jgi:nicotinamide riboside kinase